MEQKKDSSKARDEEAITANADSVFNSAEFHLYCRKIISCSKRFAHEWTTCPFAHPGEKAKRRDPRTHNYDCEMCPAVVKGEVCELGAACPHSHHVFESWLHPQKFRTMLCKDGDACHREVCFFAHGAEQLRVPSRDLPHMPLAGPSRLRSSLDRSEAARQAGAVAAAVAAAGTTFGVLHNPQSAAASASMAAAQFEAMNGGATVSAGKRVWFQTLPQQQRQVPMMQQGVSYNMFASNSAGSNVIPGGLTAVQRQGSAMAMLPFSDSLALSPGLSPEVNTWGANHGNNSGSWAVFAPGQQADDSRRSSLGENSASSTMVFPSVGQNIGHSSPQQHAAAAGLQLQAAAMQRNALANASNGLSDVADISMLLSSLLQEVNSSRQEAVDSRSAAVLAREQLKALTEALAYSQSVAGQNGEGTDASQLQAVVAAAAGLGLSAEMNDAMVPAANREMQQADTAVTAEQSQSLHSEGNNTRLTLNHNPSDASSMSCSGNAWTHGSAGLSDRYVSSSPAVGGGSARCSFDQPAEHAALRGMSLDQATAAAGGDVASMANYKHLLRQQSCMNGMPNTYPIAAGYANGANGVADWLQLLPNASGSDSLAAAAATGGMQMLDGMEVANTATNMAQFGTYRGSLDLNRLGSAAAIVSAPGLALSGSLLQQNAQLPSDYLLQLQRTHGLLSAPDLAFIASTTAPLQDTLQQQHYNVRSASGMLQGWGAGGKVAEECMYSSGAQDGLMSSATETVNGGSSQLGWL